MPGSDVLIRSDGTRIAEGRAADDVSIRTVSTELVYFSSVSCNTHRFIEKLGRPASRIPLYSRQERLKATEPFVLVLPTYGGGPTSGAVPKQVITFLNDVQNRSLIRGVIAAGNTNFGEAFCLAGDIVARKCTVPLIYRFEVFGTPDDLDAVQDRLDTLWKQL